MRDLIAGALRERAQADETARRIVDEELLDFRYFNGNPGRHDFSACRFPGIIGQHYARMERAERKS